MRAFARDETPATMLVERTSLAVLLQYPQRGCSCAGALSPLEGRVEETAADALAPPLRYHIQSPQLGLAFASTGHQNRRDA
jgi:hypothetical protein